MISIWLLNYAGRLISRSRMGIPVIGEPDLAVSSCTVRTLALSICNRWARPMSFHQNSLLSAESCVKAAGWTHLSTLIPLTWHDPCLKFTKAYYLQCRVKSLQHTWALTLTLWVGKSVNKLVKPIKWKSHFPVRSNKMKKENIPLEFQ